MTSDWMHGGSRDSVQRVEASGVGDEVWQAIYLIVRRVSDF